MLESGIKLQFSTLLSLSLPLRLAYYFASSPPHLNTQEEQIIPIFESLPPCETLEKVGTKREKKGSQKMPPFVTIFTCP